MYEIINLASIIICIVFGVVFIIVPIPNQKHLLNYKISLKVLAVAYFVFAAFNLIIFLSGNQNVPDFLSFFSTLQASVQALLFFSTLLILYNPMFITRRFLYQNLLPILSFCLLFFIFKLIFKTDAVLPIYSLFNLSNIINLLSVLFFLFYCFQLSYYTWLFRKEEKKYRKEINNYFSNSSKLRQQWVNFAFYSALFIGVLALAYQLFPYRLFDLIFSTILMVFYFVFSIKYINYNRIFVLIEPAIIDFSESETNELHLRNTKTWKEYKKEIISNKYYLKESITLGDLSQILKIGRNTLSSFINNEEGKSFNTWINNLRIDEAKSIFIEKPQITIGEVSEMTGFSEQSNFSRQFKIVTGNSPSVWKRNLSS